MDRIIDRVVPLMFFLLATLLSVALLLLVVGLRKGERSGPCPNENAPAAPAPARTNMPPGYVLEVNQAGLYRPLEEKDRIPLLWFHGAGTRQAAIDRAWSQYEYEHPVVTDVWRAVECKREGGER